VECHRGSTDDVLDRFYQAARRHRPDHIVRLTGDCPLADPGLIDELIQFYLAHDYDYASNCARSTLPDGLDAEVFRFGALERAWREARLASQREHVTPYIHQNPAKFRIGCKSYTPDLSHLRWTVDEPADYELVGRIYDALYPTNPEFTTQDILQLLSERPELAGLNTKHARNEGYAKSLAYDKLI
jgi:spore coat polysaccharide biosynthesis protein SpsF